MDRWMDSTGKYVEKSKKSTWQVNQIETFARSHRQGKAVPGIA